MLQSYGGDYCSVGVKYRRKVEDKKVNYRLQKWAFLRGDKGYSRLDNTRNEDIREEL